MPVRLNRTQASSPPLTTGTLPHLAQAAPAWCFGVPGWGTASGPLQLPAGHANSNPAFFGTEGLFLDGMKASDKDI